MADQQCQPFLQQHCPLGLSLEIILIILRVQLVFEGSLKSREKEKEHKSQVWNHKVRLQGGSLYFLLSGSISSAALRDLSIHLLWLRLNAPTTHHSYSIFILLISHFAGWLNRIMFPRIIINQNYGLKQWRQRKFLTRPSNRKGTSKTRCVKWGERKDLGFTVIWKIQGNFSKLTVTDRVGLQPLWGTNNVD